MMNMILTQCYLLQPPCSLPYSGITFDGACFYACQENTPTIYCLDGSGEVTCCFPTAQCYRSISYDCKADCIWALTHCWDGIIYKLNRECQEMGRIYISKRDISFHDIAYSAQSDSLLLSGASFLFNVSKKGDTICEYKNAPNHMTLAAAQLDHSIVEAMNYMYASPTVLKLLEANLCTENIACLPEGHSCCAICPVCSPIQTTLFLLTVKDRAYSYLLKYRCLTTNPYSQRCPADEEWDDMVCIQEIILPATE